MASEKSRTKIIADSTCDLSQEVIDQYNIDIVPLTINMDGQSLKDRIDITPDQLFAKLTSLKTVPTTAMPAPTDFMNLMEKAVDDGYKNILCICMSSGTSGSYQAAVIAKELFYEAHPQTDIHVNVVDSLGMSHGTGYLILKTARLREKGYTFDELTAFIENHKLQVKHFLTVDDLEQLIRSGRISNTSGFVGKLLNIKPIMSMKNSKGAIVAKERGRSKVLAHYVNQFKERNDTELTDFIIIGYTSDKPYAESLKEKLLLETGFQGDIYMMQMGVAVGVHVGLGGLSLFFMEKKKTHTA